MKHKKTHFLLLFTALCNLLVPLFPLGSTEEETSSVPRQLSEHDIYMRDDFTHEGYRKRNIDIECEKDKNACKGTEKTLFNPTVEVIIGSVSKIYGMISMMGGGLSIMGKDGKVVDKFDYCGILATAGEAVALANQQVGQTTLEASTIDKDQQLSSLYKAKRSHELREKTALIQGSAWAAAAACYVLFAAKSILNQQQASRNGASSVPGPQGNTTPGGNTSNTNSNTGTMDSNKGPLLKLGGKAVLAGLLSTYYFLKYKLSHEAVSFIQNIIDKLKGNAFDCDPIKNRNCYCAQPETKNDTEYCFPERFKPRLAKQDPATISSCISNDLRPDSDCSCLTFNNCYDVKYGQFASSLPFAGTQLAASQKVMQSLARGNLNPAYFSSDGNQRAAAAIRQVGPNHPFHTQALLTPEQTNEAKALSELLGAPSDVARFVATQSLNDKARAFLANEQQANVDFSNLKNLDIPSNANSNNSRGAENSKVVYFNEQGGSRNHNQDDQNNIPNYQELLNRANKKGTSPQDQVLSFAEKAQARAQIYQHSSYSIFDLLSNRYRQSVWQTVPEFTGNAP